MIAPGAIGVVEVVVGRAARVDVGRVVLHVDPEGEDAAGPQQPRRLAQDRRDVSRRDVLERVRARDEVDGRGGKPRRSGVTRRVVGDPEAVLELLGRADGRRPEVADLPARLLLERRALAAERRNRRVDELEPEVRPDIHEHLPAEPEGGVRERDREVPAGAELVPDRLARRTPPAVALVRAQMCVRAGELARHARVSDRQPPRDVPLEEVVRRLGGREGAQPVL